MRSRATKRSRPRKSPAASFMTPPSSITTTSASPWRRPIWKSLASCAGVIFNAPVPNLGSTASSATMGISRRTSGSTAVAPTSPV